MSQTDSFIDEVTEEVRRDKFYAFLRRFGWIGILAVCVLVGGRRGMNTPNPRPGPKPRPRAMR
ncbi:hypothetical protein [Celeribacter baekdonensis]|uniref:hypothetical protein n=1 Tax=Celeribacter baekdonensis TaxID=875171 RepID=UPI00131F2E0A|nr:hypothetical protein [Celeribacter baekdonensis]